MVVVEELVEVIKVRRDAAFKPSIPILKELFAVEVPVTDRRANNTFHLYPAGGV